MSAKSAIAIVGGGMAGLYLGLRLLELKDKNLNFCIYEKSSQRLGGRIKTGELTISIGGEKSTVRPELGAMRFTDRHLIFSSMVRNLVKIKDARTQTPQLGRKGPFDLDTLYYLRGTLLTRADFLAGQIPYKVDTGELGKTPEQLLEYAIIRAFEWIQIKETGTKRDRYVERHFITKIKRHQEISCKKWIELAEKGRFQGVDLRNIGFWNLIKHFLSSEAFLLVHDGFGFASVISNWSAPEAFKWLIADFSPHQQFMNVPGGFNQIAKDLETRIGNDRINLGYALQTISKRGNSFLLGFENGEAVEADKVVLALPPRALAKIEFSPLTENRSELRKWQKLVCTSRPHRLEKVYLTYDYPWWKYTQVPKSDSGRVFTDLPMRQIYYFGPDWLKENKYLSGNRNLSMILVYNDSHYEGFWRTFTVCDKVYISDDFPNETDDQKTWEKWQEKFLGPLPADLRNINLEAGKDAGFRIKFECSGGRTVRHRMEDKIRNQLRELHAFNVPRSLGGTHRDWAEEGGWHTWEPFVNVREVKSLMFRPLVPALDAVAKPLDLQRASVYVCGEAYAWEQGWIEGALMSSEAVFRAFCEERKKTYSRPPWVSVTETDWNVYMYPEFLPLSNSTCE